MRVIDTHTHFYDPTRPQGVPWPGKGTKLYRKVLPSDWLALAARHGCRETVVVEASPWVEDNQWILDLAAGEKSIVGFVGHLDPGADFEGHLRRFSNNPVFRGIRWSSSHLADESKKDAVKAGARLLAEMGLELDLNGPCTNLPAAAKLAAEVPELRIVINHLGASGDPQALRPEWKPAIKEIALRPNVFMKVSALGIEEQRVSVILDLQEGETGSAAIGNGFRIVARITLWEGKDLLAVPVAALFRQGGDWAAYAVLNGRAVLRTLELGARNEAWAEVKAGLAAGDRVILHPSDQMADGLAVEPISAGNAMSD